MRFLGWCPGRNAGNLDVDAEALFHFVNHGSALVVGLAGAHEHLVVAGLQQGGDAGQPGILVGGAGVQGDQDVFIVLDIGGFAGSDQVIDALGVGDAVLLLQAFQDSAGDLNVLGVALGSQAGGDQEAFAAVLAGILFQPVTEQRANLGVFAPMQPAKLV